MNTGQSGPIKIGQNRCKRVKIGQNMSKLVLNNSKQTKPVKTCRHQSKTCLNVSKAGTNQYKTAFKPVLKTVR